MSIPRPPLHAVALVLGAVFLVEFVVSGISPIARDAWLLENVIVVVGVAILATTWRKFPFSRISYTMVFLFLSLHEIGAHYTYSLVPYDEACMRVFGFSLNEALGFERNHFDRAIHFAYGLLLTYPIREVYVRVVDVRGVWGYVLPLGFTMSTSMIYELIEWGAAVIFGGDLGMHYLGTQGDIWDAHWDMLLATLGAVIAMGITLALNASLQRDFAMEWAHSLTVKSDKPLGEEALAEMLDDGD